jgi:hypothetical protein
MIKNQDYQLNTSGKEHQNSGNTPCKWRMGEGQVWSWFKGSNNNKKKPREEEESGGIIVQHKWQ